MGSALVILTSQYISELTGSTDLSRMPAQVISGIGFLGAGTILVMGGNRIKGLTSASQLFGLVLVWGLLCWYWIL
ncbi:MgtC/SapB family protein [Erysipelothrix sp. D19-032]